MLSFFCCLKWKNLIRKVYSIKQKCAHWSATNGDHKFSICVQQIISSCLTVCHMTECHFNLKFPTFVCDRNQLRLKEYIGSSGHFETSAGNFKQGKLKTFHGWWGHSRTSMYGYVLSHDFHWKAAEADASVSCWSRQSCGETISFGVSFAARLFNAFIRPKPQDMQVVSWCLWTIMRLFGPCETGSCFFEKGF